MQKEKIYIYGDSFGDINYSPGGKRHQWMRRLTKNYTVYNRAKLSTGPDYSFRCLANDIHKVTKQDYCIFILSESRRLYFKNIPVSLQCEASHMTTPRLKELCKEIPGSRRNDLIATLKTIVDEDFLFYDQLKHFFAVSNLSHAFKKTVLIPLDTLLLDNHQRKMIPDNLYLAKKGITDIQKEEPEHKEFEKTITKDFRSNHLNLDNHMKLFNALVDYFVQENENGLDQFFK